MALLLVVESSSTEVEPRRRRFYTNLYTGEGGEDVEGFAYELIAWIAAVIGRLHAVGLIESPGPVFDPMYRQVPRLERAGWYPNPPKFGDTSTGDAQVQRFWDGAQWTSRIRVRQYDSWQEHEHSLHDPPAG